MDSYESAVSRVQALYKKGMKFGTQTTRKILDNLGCPDLKLKIIHVAGTNGKGSTCEYLTQILIAAGKRTGTFQSPAVYDYNEQFRIDGKPVSEEKLGLYFTKTLAAADGMDVTGFEAETASAILAFAEEGCEYAVIECGMGGLLDATNAVKRKELAIITSIGLEHTAHLGKNLSEICRHKAGIITDCPAIVSAYQPKEVFDYFSKKSVIFGGQPQDFEQKGLDGQSFSYGGKPFQTKMFGVAQAFNAITAIDAARYLKISESAIYSGVKSAKLCGRLEVLHAKDKNYLLDGAHNPAGFAPLKEFLKNGVLKGGISVIYGSLSDKDIDGNLQNLTGLAEKIIAVQPDNPRGMELQKIKTACGKYFANTKTAKSVSAALAMADTENVVVCGTFTILGEAKKWIEKKL